MSKITLYSDIRPSSAGTQQNFDAEIRAAAAEDLKTCPWKREVVAEALSMELGRTITVAQIDAVVAATKPHRFPAEWIPAWTKITGSRRILELLARGADLYVVDETEHALAEYGRAAIEKEKAAARAAELRERIWGRV